MNKDRISIKNSHKQYLEQIKVQEIKKKVLQEEARKDYDRVIKQKKQIQQQGKMLETQYDRM